MHRLCILIQLENSSLIDKTRSYYVKQIKRGGKLLPKKEFNVKPLQHKLGYAI